MTELTKELAEHLAEQIREIREDWDVRGIVAALAKVRERPFFELALAARFAALDQSNRTPEVIALDGEHWRLARAALRTSSGRRELADSERCDVCSRAKDQCEDAQELHPGSRHDFRSVSDAKQDRARDMARREREREQPYDPTRGNYPPAHHRQRIRDELAAAQQRFAEQQAALAAGTGTDELATIPVPPESTPTDLTPQESAQPLDHEPESEA